MKMRLKEALTRELKGRNISLRKLARDCDIPLSVLHGWVNGVSPSGKNIEHLLRLSERLGTSIDTLLFNAKSGRKDSTILLSFEFKDVEGSYNLTIEKMKGSKS